MSDAWDLSYETDTVARLSDEWRTYQLLCGEDVRLPNKQLGKAYFEPGSEAERDARAALARLIRKGEPFPEFIRETLAGLFDPESSTVPVDRRIEFKRLPGELKSRPDATLEIALHVWLQWYRGDKKEAAVSSAMKQFGLKRSQVFAICRKHASDVPKLSRRLSNRIR